MPNVAVLAPVAAVAEIGPAAVVLLALLVAAGVALARSSLGSGRLARRRVAATRTRAQHRLDVAADAILALHDRVALGSPQAQQTFAEATAGYAEASAAFDKATTEAQVTGLGARLDRVAWQLDVTAALLDGRPLPPAPPRVGWNPGPPLGRLGAGRRSGGRHGGVGGGRRG